MSRHGPDTTGSGAPTKSRCSRPGQDLCGSALGGGHLGGCVRQDGEEVADDAEVGDLEDRGGVIAFGTKIERITRNQAGWMIQYAGDSAGELSVDAVIMEFV